MPDGACVSTIRKIAASAATALLLCASEIHATSELPFDENAVSCDGGCEIAVAEDGFITLSSDGWIRVTESFDFAKFQASNRNLTISSGAVMSTVGSAVDTSSLAVEAGSVLLRASTFEVVSLESIHVGDLRIERIRDGAVLTAIEPPALLPLDAEALDAGGPTLSLATLPEPTTAVLLGAGLALLGLARRR